MHVFPSSAIPSADTHVIRCLQRIRGSRLTGRHTHSVQQIHSIMMMIMTGRGMQCQSVIGDLLLLLPPAIITSAGTELTPSSRKNALPVIACSCFLERRKKERNEGAAENQFIRGTNQSRKAGSLSPCLVSFEICSETKVRGWRAGD